MTNVPLRHVTVDIDAKQGAGLPGGALMGTVEHIEVLASMGTHGDGMDLVVDIAFLEGMDVDDIRLSSIVVHDVHARNGRHVVATIHTTGPIMALFTTTEVLALATDLAEPQSRTPHHDFRHGRRCPQLSQGNGFACPGQPQAPHLTIATRCGRIGPSLSPRRQEVLETAQKMGYYDTPRRCSRQNWRRSCR